MSRVAVCLFFIAIFQHGIIKSLADETTTEDVSKKTEETTTKPTEDEPAKGTEVPAKIEAEDKSGTSKSTSDVPQKKADIPNEGKAAETKNSIKKGDIPNEGKAAEPKDSIKKVDIPNEGKAAEPNDSKNEEATEKTAGSDNRKSFMSKGNSKDQTNGLFDFPKNILGPVSAVGAKINEVVFKSIDTAKKVAGGTFNLLRTSVNSAFE